KTITDGPLAVVLEADGSADEARQRFEPVVERLDQAGVEQVACAGPAQQGVDVPAVDEHADAAIQQRGDPGGAEVVLVEVREADRFDGVEVELRLGEAAGGGAGAEPGIDEHGPAGPRDDGAVAAGPAAQDAQPQPIPAAPRIEQPGPFWGRLHERGEKSELGGQNKTRGGGKPPIMPLGSGAVKSA